MTASPFSLLFASQLMKFGLNPVEWCFDTWVCLREKSFVIRHIEDPDFKLKGCLKPTASARSWKLDSLALISV